MVTTVLLLSYDANLYVMMQTFTFCNSGRNIAVEMGSGHRSSSSCPCHIPFSHKLSNVVELVA